VAIDTQRALVNIKALTTPLTTASSNDLIFLYRGDVYYTRPASPPNYGSPLERILEGTWIPSTRAIRGFFLAGILQGQFRMAVLLCSRSLRAKGSTTHTITMGPFQDDMHAFMCSLCPVGCENSDDYEICDLLHVHGHLYVCPLCLDAYSSTLDDKCELPFELRLTETSTPCHGLARHLDQYSVWPVAELEHPFLDHGIIFLMRSTTMHSIRNISTAKNSHIPRLSGISKRLFVHGR